MRKVPVLLLAFASMAMGNCSGDASKGGSPWPTLQGSRAAYVASVQREAPPIYAARTPLAGLSRLENPAQRFVATLDRGGLVVASDDEPWLLSIRVTAIGCEDARGPVVEAAPEAKGNEVRYRRGGLEEWYLNGPLGIEQGFSIAERPSCAGPKVVALGIEGDLSAKLVDADGDGRGESARFVDEEGRERVFYSDLSVKDATGKQVPAWLSAAAGELSIVVDDVEAAYPLVIDPLVWVQDAMLTPSDGNAGDRFGQAVAAWGDTVIIGAPTDDDKGLDAGAAYVFVSTAAGWVQQQKIWAGDGAPGDQFGHSVSIEGNVAIVGAPFDDDKGANAGAVYVFSRSGGVWLQQTKLTASNGAADDQLGYAVSLSGDTALVGAPGNDNVGPGFGAFYVYETSGGVWSETQICTKTGLTPQAHFGKAIAHSGDTAIIGAPDDDLNQVDAGSAYIFERSGGSWSLSRPLTVAPVGGSSPNFGASVAVTGDTALVGRPGLNGNTGAAHVFTQNGGSWGALPTEKKLQAIDGMSGDRFGSSVSLSTEYALIGAQGLFAIKGAAYLFERNGGFAQQTKILTISGVEDEDLNVSVSLSGELAAVGGAPVSASYVGSAYAFALLSGNGDVCFTGGECASGFCVDGVCCDSACGGDDPGDCQACSQATGATADGACTPLSGSSCDDGISCTQNDSCASGVCQGTAVICPGDTCRDGYCDPGSGACAYVNKPDGTLCNDGDLCTQADSCNGGTCTSQFAVVCIANDQCHDAGMCDPSTGVCSDPVKPDGSSCNDSNACTTGEACASGVCKGGVDVVCTAIDQCHDAGTCDPSAGCSNPTKADSSPCDDGNACTQTDTCQSGACTGKNPTICASDACHDGYCDPSTGGCVHPNKIDGTLCNDGDPCTTADSCVSGQCVGAPSCGKLDNGEKCSSPAQCLSGFCADGVCCDSECKGKCHHCALPETAGVCTVAPKGVDLRGECSTGGPCTGTCSGSGDPANACTGFIEGMVCSPPACTADRAQSVPAGTCMTEGGACEVRSAAANCTSGLLCDLGTGACPSRCRNVNDCASGYACDESGNCVKPAPASTGIEPSCSFSPGSSSNRSVTAAVCVLLGGLFITRRRRVNRSRA